jgi:cell shape-determining protein MreC
MNAAKLMKQLQETIDGLNGEMVVLQKKLKKTQVELAKYTSPDQPVFLSPTIMGKVVVSDPKWDFVVINVGEDQGILKDGELLVNRNGQLVAKVKVTSVEKGRCIANVVPGWKLGEVQEGDQVFPAYPST